MKLDEGREKTPLLSTTAYALTTNDQYRTVGSYGYALHDMFNLALSWDSTHEDYVGNMGLHYSLRVTLAILLFSYLFYFILFSLRLRLRLCLHTTYRPVHQKVATTKRPTYMLTPRFSVMCCVVHGDRASRGGSRPGGARLHRSAVSLLSYELRSLVWLTGCF